MIDHQIINKTTTASVTASVQIISNNPDAGYAGYGNIYGYAASSNQCIHYTYRFICSNHSGSFVIENASLSAQTNTTTGCAAGIYSASSQLFVSITGQSDVVYWVVDNTTISPTVIT